MLWLLLVVLFFLMVTALAIYLYYRSGKTMTMSSGEGGSNDSAGVLEAAGAAGAEAGRAAGVAAAERLMSSSQ